MAENVVMQRHRMGELGLSGNVGWLGENEEQKKNKGFIVSKSS